MKSTATGSILVLAACLVWGRAVERAPDPENLEKQIEALKPATLAWREIAWKTCLLEGLKESREKNKPVLLWIFIDRPADDARC